MLEMNKTKSFFTPPYLQREALDQKWSGAFLSVSQKFPKSVVTAKPNIIPRYFFVQGSQVSPPAKDRKKLERLAKGSFLSV